MAGLSGFAHPPGGMLAVLEDRGLRRTFQGRTESGGPLPPTSRPAIRSTVPGSATDTPDRALCGRDIERTTTLVEG
jgi:hypothetical protein